jgi:hypothetical protein
MAAGIADCEPTSAVHAAFVFAPVPRQAKVPSIHAWVNSSNRPLSFDVWRAATLNSDLCVRRYREEINGNRALPVLRRATALIVLAVVIVDDVDP